MPSKARKSSRPPPTAADRGPLPNSPATPGREPSEAGDDEALHRRLLSDASAKFPGLISDAAFCGRISETESSCSKGARATVWLSETAMVSSSFVPGSLVSVSLAASGKKPLDNFPLDTLAEDCARHFGFDVSDRLTDGLGSYFAIANVLPSRKVLKNGVRLSWGLSCTMGFPATGRAVFVCPIENMSNNLNRTDNTPQLYLCKCKDLYLDLVPPKPGHISCGKGLSISDSPTKSVPIGNWNVASPKTPSSRQSKLSSPVASPMHSRKPHDCVLSTDSSTCLDVSAARLVLADEGVNELLQIYAARWLYGRHLLKGNFATVPLCGQMWVFLVHGLDKLSACCSNQDLTSENYKLLPHEIQILNSLEQVQAAFLVDSGTKVHFSDSMLDVGTTDKVELPAEKIKYKANCDNTADVPRLGGLSKEFAALKETILFSLADKDALPRYKGVLLYGPPGTGKTSLASSCAHNAGASLFCINGPEIISQYYGESEQALHEVFDSARRAAPAVVFIDELDAIAPARKYGGEELSLRMVATLLKLMDEINSGDRILVIAATNRPDSIDPALRRPGRLDREIEIGVPSPEQRSDILRTLLSEMDHSLSSTEIESLALATHGFVGADLAALCNEAAMTALRRHIKLKGLCKQSKKTFCEPDGDVAGIQGSDICKDEDGASLDQVSLLSSSLSELSVSSRPISTVGSQGTLECCVISQHGSYRPHEVEEDILLKVMAEDFEKAMMKVRPSAMREVMLELPKVRWEDVGGQAKVKKQLIEAVQWPQICPDAFRRIGIRPPRGLLMIGPPGCSKTLMARAVASEAKLNFLAVKGPELFSKWVGESEKAVRSLFAKARVNSPAIIFFDEIDGLAVTRGQENDGTSVADRVLSQLLVEMDGLDQRIGVTVIAATNRPDKIDHALLRPGRFDRLLDVQPPDESDREDIFRIHMRNMPCSPDVNAKDLANLTEGYTGADIKLICREAAIAALEENLEISEVSMAHFRIGVSRVQPSNVQFYQELAAQFRRLVDTGSVRDE
ncbi:calmodulin-interacting protein 111 [Phoenix dactylifera]|uniref:Calmodulin-interacting protein 111 n=1 Tax=Phoenix dactylifera TaxID=42345 RepID=A0A8B7BW01_PHODC|nr:calmodulin-interacting protein 111 [Phoenix dactylifera]